MKASAAYMDSSKSQDPAVSTTPECSLVQRRALDNAIRVDQAGEVAANWIYRGQLSVLGSDPVGPLIQVRSAWCGRLYLQPNFRKCGIRRKSILL
jgi:ubiquinone biosynthesis monooxygenase Coq7